MFVKRAILDGVHDTAKIRAAHIVLSSNIPTITTGLLYHQQYLLSCNCEYTKITIKALLIHQEFSQFRYKYDPYCNRFLLILVSEYPSIASKLPNWAYMYQEINIH